MSEVVGSLGMNANDAIAAVVAFVPGATHRTHGIDFHDETRTSGFTRNFGNLIIAIVADPPVGEDTEVGIGDRAARMLGNVTGVNHTGNDRGIK